MAEIAEAWFLCGLGFWFVFTFSDLFVNRNWKGLIVWIPAILLGPLNLFTFFDLIVRQTIAEEKEEKD